MMYWGTHLELCLGNLFQYWPGSPLSFGAVAPFLGPARDLVKLQQGTQSAS